MNDLLTDTLDAVSRASAPVAHERVEETNHHEPTETHIKTTKHLDPCPVCGQTEFYSARTRGSHMYWKHGIHGTSTDSIAHRKKVAEEKKRREAQKTHTHRSHHKKMGRPVGSKNKSVVATETPAEPAHMAHVFYLVGYFTSHLEAYCRQAGIPLDQVTKKVGIGLSSR